MRRPIRFAVVFLAAMVGYSALWLVVGGHIVAGLAGLAMWESARHRLRSGAWPA